MQYLANTSNRIHIIEPSDEDIDEQPYDYPAQWIARALDGRFSKRPRTIAELWAFTADAHAALGQAADNYARAVMDSDTNPDKSDAALRRYRAQFLVTAIPSSDRWDERTLTSGPIALAVASGPHFAVVLVLRGDGLHVQSLSRDGMMVQVSPT